MKPNVFEIVTAFIYLLGGYCVYDQLRISRPGLAFVVAAGAGLAALVAMLPALTRKPKR